MIGFRPDGGPRPLRTNWLSFAEPTKRRTYGSFTFTGCSQPNNQKESELPLIQVAPGANVVLRECNFHAEEGLRNGGLAEVYSSASATATLRIENSDGIHQHVSRTTT